VRPIATTTLSGGRSPSAEGVCAVIPWVAVSTLG
jgi:hypothetical protein